MRNSIVIVQSSVTVYSVTYTVTLGWSEFIDGYNTPTAEKDRRK